LFTRKQDKKGEKMATKASQNGWERKEIGEVQKKK